ncbi:MAG TPA: glycine dehydrogenase (aminomethyl-transferring) [Elusimicrobia bacterium]|nr:glycine dehydrogenase (aminomethyl-transferring) [Elusimicrobiota bacterium]HBT61447.1 glycine dehydrogenase (aminomethyl-transferring) [Elusimicrobiota bacterium]
MPVTEAKAVEPLAADSFTRRHLGPSQADVAEMLKFLGYPSLQALAEAAVPADIRLKRPLHLPEAMPEHEAISELKALAGRNQLWRSFLGMGYQDAVTPAVIVRHVLENPGWYTAYTPYQAEIAQGRLEALLIFQTMVRDLTALDVANASLLDEATAAAEAMSMSKAVCPDPEARAFFVSQDCHPQTIAVLRTRAQALGWEVIVAGHEKFDFSSKVFGVLVQYPKTDGAVCDYSAFFERAHKAGALTVVAADIMSLVALKAPGEFGADIAVGSVQRFGLPLGFGGPHAAYMATRDAYKRHMPGRIVGVAKDSSGRPALRLALQTREQHIRREKATSNICTAQVLPAVASAFYAVYHGPDGLKRIARRLHALATLLAEGGRRLGWKVSSEPFFDTVRLCADPKKVQAALSAARDRRINLRLLEENAVVVALGETTQEEDIEELLESLNGGRKIGFSLRELPVEPALPESLARRGAYLEHRTFNRYHCEHEMLRFVKRLESKDLSLTTSMIPLGSCTMKLNAASEMLSITWPEFGKLHPYAPLEQAEGYRRLIKDLESWICEITGFSAVSFQPNSGAQGEFTGLLVIRKFHESRNEGARRVCLIPVSAHGTNPASAAMAGMTIVPVACTPEGDIDLADLKAKAEAHAADLAAIMVTYPSTHGVFEPGIKELCSIVHKNGGLVYMDGANMNAQVGLCRPADIGADVCHLNLHKTFASPHGGGGPGMGPIAVSKALAALLPRHPLAAEGGTGIGPVAAAPYSSASILPIAWSYVAQMGPEGLREASQIAILNANYVARKLGEQYPVLYKGRTGLVAHECILDLRHLKSCEVTVDDVAKRLMDYGFHAPTVSWPVSGTVMVEPTESESKAELDRFCAAMLAIRCEAGAIEQGKADRVDNVLKNAPHTAPALCADKWDHPYSREQAAYPAPWLREHKFWPAVGRVDNAFGDRNFCCVLPQDG